VQILTNEVKPSDAAAVEESEIFGRKGERIEMPATLSCTISKIITIPNKVNAGIVS
jgi:hypothetical protein